MSGLGDLAATARGIPADRTAVVPEHRRAREAVRALRRAAGPPPKVGLVLAGGGAKGAYHVGVVECLASARVPLHAIAGASIGALNGAVLACARNLDRGAAALGAIWDEVAAYSADAPRGSALADLLGLAVQETTMDRVGLLLKRLAGPVVRPEYLEKLVAAHVTPALLDGGMPLWVSAFPALEELAAFRGWGWALDLLRSQLGTRAEWLHVNALPVEQQRLAVLASAALPVVLPARRVDGRLFRDGGLADNTPVGALAFHEHCDIVIVVHLTDGVLWDSHDFPGLDVIEIRPTRSMSSPGPLGGTTALVDFSPERLARLRELGHQDTSDILRRLDGLISAVRDTRSAEHAMLESVAELDDSTGTGE